MKSFIRGPVEFLYDECPFHLDLIWNSRDFHYGCTLIQYNMLMLEQNSSKNFCIQKRVISNEIHTAHARENIITIQDWTGCSTQCMAVCIYWEDVQRCQWLMWSLQVRLRKKTNGRTAKLKLCTGNTNGKSRCPSVSLWTGTHRQKWSLQESISFRRMPPTHQYWF